jgi:hypothetical protein
MEDQSMFNAVLSQLAKEESNWHEGKKLHPGKRFGSI